MNNRHRFRFVNATTVGCLVLIGFSVHADDWPQLVHTHTEYKLRRLADGVVARIQTVVEPVYEVGQPNRVDIEHCGEMS